MAKRKKQKMSMPMSGAGLVRYMDEDGTGLKLKPEHVIYAAGGVVGLNILVKLGFL